MMVIVMEYFLLLTIEDTTILMKGELKNYRKSMSSHHILMKKNLLCKKGVIGLSKQVKLGLQTPYAIKVNICVRTGEKSDFRYVSK